MKSSENEGIELSEAIVVRLLNSDLKGCEFTLTTGVTHFFVADSEVIQKNTLHQSCKDNTIFVPMNKGGVNFDIIVTHENIELGQPRVFLRNVTQPGKDDLILASNHITYVGMLALAMRSHSTIWHDEILNYSTEASKISLINVIDKKWRHKGVWYLLIGMGVMLSFIAYAYFNNHQKQMKEISSLLGQKYADYNYICGNDDVNYVFAYNGVDKNWAQQAFVRSPPQSVVKVMDVLTEEARLSDWLEIYWPSVKILRIKLTEPHQPLLTLSKERGGLASEQKKALVDALKKHFPYVENINFSILSDKNMVLDAEKGLNKIAVPYKKKEYLESVTFVIQGAIDDSQLERVKSFVQGFEQNWGGHYVQFVVELKKDWLNGKSFKYGSEGYVKISPSHWYFPKPLSIEERVL